jgi:membrane fusion protein (multidrug efflux system)
MTEAAKDDNAQPARAVPGNGKAAKRRQLILTAIAIFVVIGVAYGGYQYWDSLHYAYTDDAYVQGDLVQVTPQVGGTVVAINADDTQLVKAGQTLVRLDGADTQVALQQAEANLAQAVRQVRVSFANNGTLAAQVAVRQTDVATAKTALARAEDALRRRQELAGTGAVGAEELRQAQLAVQAAKAALSTAEAGVEAAREQLASGEALTAGTVIASNPAVRLAAARVREAYLAYERTTIPAPVSGVVARRSVQLGQRVAPGLPLMWVVPLNNVWVDANLKETQLRDVRIGQPAKVVADTYGGDVTYTGHVVGLAAGTGAAFSLLPAQNATGNWIKVVQRLPVRIALDAKQLAAHPLRVGMSTEVTVDISDHSGAPVVDAPPRGPAAQTDVYAADWKRADTLVNAIIAGNAGNGHKAR